MTIPFTKTNVCRIRQYILKYCKNALSLSSAQNATLHHNQANLRPQTHICMFILSRPCAVAESNENILLRKALAFRYLIVCFYYTIKAILRKQFAFLYSVSRNFPYILRPQTHIYFISYSFKTVYGRRKQ